MVNRSALRILGIDSGYTAAGFTVVETDLRSPGKIIHGECYETAAYGGTTSKKKRESIYKSEDDASRVIAVSDRITELVVRFSPDLSVIELPTGGGKNSGAVKGMAIGATLTVVTLRRCGVDQIYVTPRANKIGSTGNPNAEKPEVFAAVRATYPAFVWPRMKKDPTRYDDELCWAIADAASAVLTYIKMLRT